ncbi:MAG: NAD-dependent epimerase/dehydratase family protein, partial [Acidimicrobiales bacterium]
MEMRVVVVGATGNVGGRLLERLAQDGRVADVLAIARRSPGGEWSPGGPGGKVRFAAADVSRDDLAPHLTGADVVVHLAWIFQPTHRPMVTWRANVTGSERVFRAAVESGVSAIVYASSVGAYSPAPGREVDESWPTDGYPPAAYGREKAYVERILDSVEARHPGVRVVRLRPGFIFQRAAASQQRRLFMGPLVPTPLLRPGVLPVLPHPAGLRLQALHAADAASAYHLAVTGEARGAFNVAAEPVIDGRALAGLLGARPLALPRQVVRAALSLAWRARLVPADPALLDLAMSLPVMSTERARSELG